MILSDWLEADHFVAGNSVGKYSAGELFRSAEAGMAKGVLSGLFRPGVINRRCTWLTEEGWPCKLLGG